MARNMQFQHSEEGYGLSRRLWDHQPATTITTRSFVVCNRRLACPSLSSTCSGIHYLSTSMKAQRTATPLEIQDCHSDMHIVAGGIYLIVYHYQPSECLSVASACLRTYAADLGEFTLVETHTLKFPSSALCALGMHNLKPCA